MLVVNNPQLLSFIKSDYKVKDIQNLRKFLKEKGTFNFTKLKNGLFPASVSKLHNKYTGYTNVWIRDNIHIAHTYYKQGSVLFARKNLESLMCFFKKYKNKFINIIENKNLSFNPMNRPHVRFAGENLEEMDQKWAHAQNDALGYFLWLYCRLANQNIITAAIEEIEILSLFSLYFDAIKYWQDEDSGHWEEARKINASSIGVVMAGLEEMKCLILKLTPAKSVKYKNYFITEEFLETLIEQGRKRLEMILPSECIQSDSSKYRRYDASLLFLIYPLGVIGRDKSKKVVKDIAVNLQGDYGIKRYTGDSYWAPDYKEKLTPEKRTIDYSEQISLRNALLVEEGTEAQWCLFDSIISIIYGLEYQIAGDKESLNKQILYFNRSIGQITASEDEIPGFRCPELYFIEHGKYKPNDHVPLFWAQANLSMAFKIMEESLEL